MELDGVLGVIGLLLYWRVILCVLVASVAALVFFHLFPWLSGLQAIVIAALGILPGVMWEESTRPASPSTPVHSTSSLVAGLAAAIFAAAWGAVSSTSLHAAIAGAVILVATLWGWFLQGLPFQAWLSRAQGVLCVVTAVVAFPVAAVLAHNAS